MIQIVGLGPGDKNAITVGTLEILKLAPKVFLRTEKHPTVEFIRNLGIQFETYDEKYEDGESFDEVYNAIVEDLIYQHTIFKNIVYGVPGHPLVAEKAVSLLINRAEEENINIEILPAVSFIDAMIESLRIDPVKGLKIIDAFEMKEHILDKRIGTIITQVYNKFIASEVKLALLEYYREDTEIYFVRAAGVKDVESIRKIPLYCLDRQEDIDYLTSIYIPRDMGNTKDFYDLLSIMEQLRAENGCPWDREQTHESLKKYLIEECYEVLEAIDENNEEMLIEELGDVLFQIVFHAEIGKEEGYFNISDIIKGVSNKMIHRHPHIFGNATAENSEEVLENWEKIKKKEQGLQTYTESLKHVPKNLPSMMRAFKIQEKASRVGFDWDNVESVFEKVKEELDEVKDVYKSKNKAKIIEEVGDLMFSTVNVARFLDIEPEFALNYTVDKFIGRFDFIEQEAIKMGMDLEKMSLQQMDDLWEKSKNLKKS